MCSQIWKVLEQPPLYFHGNFPLGCVTACHFSRGVVTGPDVLGGKGAPDVAALPLHTGTSQWGKSSLCSFRPCRNTTVMGPKRGFRAGREILREDRKKQSRNLTAVIPY